MTFTITECPACGQKLADPVDQLAATIWEYLSVSGGRYASQRELQTRLLGEGVRFSALDLPAALQRLEDRFILSRAAQQPGRPRPGWLQNWGPDR